ncbi:cytochrome P450 6a2 [Folsomia candida]|uniref:cytochrome P450 6a2 n=1 Tax=Folsomia candida TaxID=158441 RepID=UPI0016055D74|nr:cytochrome P450 6a2 [Folsomia candida]XP_035710553.1 cytochrome P450 6a2 [Folsomia candida]XP_035710554.1 cytochrome P450 6a2 [Folsomia candida]
MIAFTDILWIFVFLIVFLTSYLAYSDFKDRQYFHSKKIFHFSNGIYKTIYFMIYLILKKKPMMIVYQMNYDKLKRANAKLGGRTQFGKKNFLVADSDLMKHILVKDYDHFVNRGGLNMPESDILVKRMLIFLSDEKWKGMRSKLSPTFTTGKIKRLFSLFNDSAKKLIKYVDERMAESTDGEIELGDGYSKFTMDTIASAVCGMNSQAFDQIEPSIFEMMGKKLQLSFNGRTILKFFVMISFPKFAERLGITLFGNDVHQFFAGAIKSSVKERNDMGQKGNDFIQLMLEAREDKLKTDESELDSFEKDAIIKSEVKGQASTANLLDDDGIVSNCVLFILAGFDTTQSLLLFCAYSLALHPEIQDKLRKEVEAVLDENDGDFTYDSIHRMTYLDMVINETLRFYPPAPMTNRTCSQDYLIPGTEMVVKKGDGVIIPIMAIHHDDRHYPEPEKFDPERFSPENKRKLNTYAFLAFGQGPRNCIGMRFALTEAKLAIAQLVHNFDIEPSKRTPIPMEYQNAAALKPKEGMWLALKRRSGTIAG